MMFVSYWRYVWANCCDVIMIGGLDAGCDPALINENWLGSHREMVAVKDVAKLLPQLFL